MLSLMEVLSRVLVRRAIATANVAAGEAETKMYPLAAHFETFFASMRSARSDVADLC
jgi:hypothetical protein